MIYGKGGIYMAEKYLSDEIADEHYEEARQCIISNISCVSKNAVA